MRNNLKRQCDKKTKAQIKKKYRLKCAIKSILTNHLNESYFLTLTFNDKTLNTTTKEKRLKIVKEYLNNQTDKYILNCDYGKKTEREHYHALVIAKDKFINYSLYNQFYGLLYIKPMNFNKYQTIESKTIFLLNHALKDTSEKNIIYSRAKRPTHKAKNTKNLNKKITKSLESEIKEITNTKPLFYNGKTLNKPLNKDTYN